MEMIDLENASIDKVEEAGLSLQYQSKQAVGRIQ